VGVGGGIPWLPASYTCLLTLIDEFRAIGGVAAQATASMVWTGYWNPGSYCFWLPNDDDSTPQGRCSHNQTIQVSSLLRNHR